MGSNGRWQNIPESIAFLAELSTNLWWSFDGEAQALYRSIDPDHWQGQRNPVSLLLDTPQSRFDELAADDAFVANVASAEARFRKYMSAEKTWYASVGRPLGDQSIAYFSAEFGLADALPTYSGGLGILAGDHTKSASDLGLPFVGISLLYRCGYVDQRIDENGWQQDEFTVREFDRIPIERVQNTDGRPMSLEVRVKERLVRTRIWKAQVGRVPIYFLDADDPANWPEDRAITRTLYDADMDIRIRQEILLGMGGVRLLRALGVDVGCYHLNEGHAAFSGLERMSEKIQSGKSFEAARAETCSNAVFTTHTPVEAGHDRFGVDQMKRYFGSFAEEGGLGFQGLMSLGLAPHAPAGSPFNMSYAAIRTTRACNGVSELHGEVSRQLFQPLWPEKTLPEIPVGSITNGIHAETWLAPELKSLFGDELGDGWRERLGDPAFWARLITVKAAELWAARQPARQRLIELVRWRESRRRRRLDLPAEAVAEAESLLDPKGLIVGFARRFAPYKRAVLFLQDPARLRALLGNPDRPVYFIFAGKSHPNNDFGKQLIQRVYQASQEAGLRGHIVLLENYDIELGRHLVQGVDVWLNNPRKPQEASGTSGMKAAMNGILNVSILDGWWPEGYSGRNGWAIGAEGTFWSQEERDQADANTLYEVLENEVVPRFFDRDGSGVPHSWVERMKESMRTVIPQFNTDRMVSEYTLDLYRDLP